MIRVACFCGTDFTASTLDTRCPNCGTRAGLPVVPQFDFDNITTLDREPHYVPPALERCAGCGQWLEPGDDICWGIPGHGAYHAHCYE